jgi:hypothetical protein
MTMLKVLLALAASFMLTALASPSIAGDGPCIIADPTGTPLNVRSKPNGTVLGAVHNDMQVVITASALVNGKRWVRIIPGIGKPGWVFADFVMCD